jgi:hypothetical protein
LSLLEGLQAKEQLMHNTQTQLEALSLRFKQSEALIRDPEHSAFTRFFYPAIVRMYKDRTAQQDALYAQLSAKHSELTRQVEFLQTSVLAQEETLVHERVRCEDVEGELYLKRVECGEQEKLIEGLREEKEVGKCALCVCVCVYVCRMYALTSSSLHYHFLCTQLHKLSFWHRSSWRTPWTRTWRWMWPRRWWRS